MVYKPLNNMDFKLDGKLAGMCNGKGFSTVRKVFGVN